ncbi:MAG: hypothetical protein AAFR51_10060 [Pseudomonadota bacterium]
MKAYQKLGISFLVALCAWQYAVAFGEVFESNKDYLCLTEEALFASPKISQHGEWTDPPSRFQIQIKACETFCLPQRSKDRPLSLLLQEPETDWPQKFDGYRGRADYHSIEGGSVVLSGNDLSLTRTLVGSLPGAEQHVSLVLNARCHPID